MKKLALLLALALLAAACGGGSDTNVSDTSPPAAEPTTTAAPAASTEDVEAGHTDETHDDEESDDHADDEHADDAGSAVEDGDAHTDDDLEEDVATDADRTVQVAMTDFAFEPTEFEAMAGETIEFVVTNLGVVEHEFRLSNEHRIEEHLASGHADHDDGGGHHEDGDVVLHLDPGGTGSVTVTFGEDTTLFTEVACLIPGHYEAGMKAPLRMSS